MGNIMLKIFQLFHFDLVPSSIYLYTSTEQTAVPLNSTLNRWRANNHTTMILSLPFESLRINRLIILYLPRWSHDWWQLDLVDATADSISVESQRISFVDRQIFAQDIYRNWWTLVHGYLAACESLCTATVQIWWQAESGCGRPVDGRVVDPAWTIDLDDK